MRLTHSPRAGASTVVGVILMVGIITVFSMMIGMHVLEQAQDNPPNPSADVRFTNETETSYQQYNVTIQLTARQNADYILISPESGRVDTTTYGVGGDYNGDGQIQELKTISGKVVIQNISKNDQIYIIANKDGTRKVIQTYQVG